MILDEKHKQRYFCRNKHGRDLFYLEVMYEEEWDCKLFETSLKYPIQDDPVISKQINRLVNSSLEENEQLKIINDLFFQIQLLPGIEAYYFPAELLNQHGQYIEYYHSVLNYLLHNKEFPDYSVFTSKINAFYFEYAAPYINKEILKKTYKLIDKKLFELQLKNSLELGSEYVRLYNQASVFYETYFEDSNKYNCYIMSLSRKVILFFIWRV